MAWYDPRDWDVPDVTKPVKTGVNIIEKLTGGDVPGPSRWTPSRLFDMASPWKPGSKFRDDRPIGQISGTLSPTNSGLRGRRRSGLADMQVTTGPHMIDPLQELYDQLAAQLENDNQGYSPIYSGMSLEDMQRHAEAVAAAQYDPQIEAIRRMISETQGRAERNKGEIGSMYQALSQAYEADVPKVQQMYDNAQIDAINRQKALQDALSADYQARQQSVNQEAAALGQGAAAQEAIQPIQNDQAFLQNLANTVSEQTNSNLGLLENANVAYTQQGGRLAGLEGSNRQADLMAQLEDYIRSQEGNIQGLTNQRQGDYAKYLSDLQMQDQQNRMQDNQMRMQFESQKAAQQWQQLMDLAGLKMEMMPKEEGPSISDIIAAQRLGFDQDQASINTNRQIMEMALKISEEQGISFEEAMKFVQATLYPQQQG